MFKKIIIYLLSVVLILGLTACGEKSKYEKAERLKDEQKYDEAIALFTELGDYEDTENKLLSCYNRYIEYLYKEMHQYDKALEVFDKFEDLASDSFYDLEGIKADIQAQSAVYKILNGDENDGWNELKNMDLSTEHGNTKVATEIQRTLLTADAFRESNESRYKAYKVMQYITKHATENELRPLEYDLFYIDRDYPELKLCTLEIGDTFTFGKYPQDLDMKTAEVRHSVTGELYVGGVVDDVADGNIKTKEVEWVVLDKQDSKLLVLTKNNIDSFNCVGKLFVDYDSKKRAGETPTLWEDTYGRMYLNTEVLNRMFTPNEKSHIVPTKIDNCKDSDYLFLLSYAEVEKYRNVPNFETQHTGYAILRTTEHMAMFKSAYLNALQGACPFILRKTVNDPKTRFENYTWSATTDSFIETSYVANYVRPAMWVEFKK